MAIYQSGRETSGNRQSGTEGRACTASGAVFGGRGAAAGGPASAEGAGLVPFKTSPIETSPFEGLPSENPVKTISFCPIKAAQNRVKRLSSSVWMAGHLQGLPRPGHRATQPWFVTLTYAKANAWQPDHVSKATDGFRRWCRRRGVPCAYLFVAEIQTKRAERTGDHVVHYHLLCWLPVGVRMPMWDKETRASGRQVRAFWPHGDTNTQQAKAGVGYLMKYLSKLGEFTVFPKGLRMYGMGGLTPEGRQIRQWANLPQWVKNEWGVGSVGRVGRGLVVLETGEILPPMYRRRFVQGGIELIQLREMPPKLYDHGPYSLLR